jgi:hypothetical protein
MKDDTQDENREECLMNSPSTSNENEWLTVTAKSSSSRVAKSGNSKENAKSPKPATNLPAVVAKNDYNARNVKLVRSLLDRQLKCMIILRGCSGSGKSTLAQ